MRTKDKSWQEKYMNQLQHLFELEADVATRLDHLSRLFTKLLIKKEYEALTTHFIHEMKLLDLELNGLVGIIEMLELLSPENDYNTARSTESTTKSEVSADSVQSIPVLKLLHTRFNLDSSDRDSSIKALVAMKRELITLIWKDLYVLGHLKETIQDLSDDDQVSSSEI
jgi:hypothetical protein